MSFDPKLWGPSMWKSLHYIAAAYDDQPSNTVRNNMKTFIQVLPFILPCDTCKDDAYNYIKHINIDDAVKNKTTLVHFFYMFHNDVNKRLNKPQIQFNNILKDPDVKKKSLEIPISYIMILTVIIIFLFIYK